MALTMFGVSWEGKGFAGWDDWRSDLHWKGMIARVGNVPNSRINSTKTLYTTTLIPFASQAQSSGWISLTSPNAYILFGDRVTNAPGDGLIHQKILPGDGC